MITVLHCVVSHENTDFFRGLADHHDRARFRMLLAVLGGPSRLQQDMAARGIPVWSFPLRGKRDWLPAIRSLRGLLRREGVDVVHPHLFEPSLLGVAAGRLAGTRAIVVGRHHADLHFLMKKPLHVGLDRWIGRSASRVIAVSEQVRRLVTSREGVAAHRVQVIHPGCDLLEQPRSTAAACEALRRRYRIGEGAVIGMVARLHPIKGHRVLFEALSRLDGGVPPWTLLLVGVGPLRAELEQLAERCGLGGRVVFTGFVSGEERAACYSLMDVLVHPTLEDAFSMPVIEAMAFGIPVVATPNGVAPEVIQDGGSGRLVPTGQTAPLAEALAQLLGDAALRRRLGEAGRARVGRGFRWADMTAAYEACYDELLGSSAAPRRVPDDAALASAVGA